MLMIHSLMETVEAQLSARSLGADGTRDMTSRMCPRWLICSLFKVYEHDISDTGRYQLQPRIWMKLRGISREPRGGSILLPGDARVQDFKTQMCGNVRYFQP